MADNTPKQKWSRKEQQIFKAFSKIGKKLDSMSVKEVAAKYSEPEPCHTAKDFVSVVEGTLEHVLHTAEPIRIAVESEQVYGLPTRSYGAGMEYQSELTIRTQTPIELLKVNGWPPLIVGDTVRASIVKAICQCSVTKQPVDQCPLHRLGHHMETYVPREFGQIEHPYRLEHLKDGVVVAVYQLGRLD